MKRMITTLLFLAVAASPAAALQDATNHLNALVVNANTGAPVPGAYVVVRKGADQSIAATSDVGGSVHADLQYPYFVVRRAGFLEWQGRMDKDASVPMRIPLIPEALVTGTLTDQDGFPIWRAFLSLIRVENLGTPHEHPEPMSGSVMSNDRGEFRVAGLREGRYYLRLEPASAPNLDSRYMQQLYSGNDAGGTLDERDAAVIEIAAGQQRAIQFRAAMHKGVALTGRVLMPDGRTLGAAGKRASMRLMPLTTRGVIRSSAQGDGSFVFPHVPPGKYMLLAESNSNVHPGDFQGYQEVNLESGDVRDVVLKMSVVEPIDVSGVIVMQDGSKPLPATVTLRSGFGREHSAQIADDGSFVIKGVLPELQHFVGIRPVRRPDGTFPPATPVSVLWNGRETSLSFGFEIAAGGESQLKITLPN